VALRSPSHARIPTLDGWRGIAILTVLPAHFQRAYLHHFLFGLTFLEIGQHGVTIFFVLSRNALRSPTIRRLLGMIYGDAVDKQIVEVEFAY
jgi:peptidoglycan/LPS O-acetylase OafA/YrhL